MRIISKRSQPLKPTRHKVPENLSSSFDLRHACLPHFTDPWHFHRELELHFVVSSSGMRFIGKSVERFSSGEIVLLGKHLPHYGKNDPVYFMADGRHLANQNARLSKVITYLVEHFTGPITLRSVADVASMNEAAFCRYFKAHSGQILTQYLTDLRIRYACELLIKGEYSVTDVCYQVGFENVSHFIQAFKKKRHQTPFAFKKQRTH